MRIRIVIDSVRGEDELRSVLAAHRSALRLGGTPSSCEATDSDRFNGGTVVCNMGAGFDVRSVALSVHQAAAMLDQLHRSAAVTSTLQSA